ncbi:Transmembrane 9 super member 2, partial [Spiromyces aspiralis]
YHTVDDRHYRVVGVFVTPSSRDTRVEDIEGGKCDAAGPVRIDTAAPETGVVYTYSVKWRASNKSWATRWDNYLNILDPKIHWFNLIVAIIVVVVLSSMVALILTHTLRKDIARYNSDDAEDLQEDLGWKLVHGDVFREPHHKQLLSVLVGSGSQLFCMTLSTIVFALLGFLSPSNRGSLGTAMVVLQMIFGFSAGYNSARLYHTLRGKNLKLNVAATCFFVPGIVLCMLTLLEIFLIAKGSSSAVPFKAFLGVIGLWFLVSVPLTLLGAYFGYRKRPFEHPTRTNQIPRQIPDGPWYFRPVPSAMMGGVLAF